MTTQNQSDANSANEFEERLSAYRQSLIEDEHAMQGAYDKGVLSLSGGALAISLVFLKDVVGTKQLLHSGCLLAAWILWALSIALVLTSYFTSAQALRRALTDTDEKAIYITLAQSHWATATKVLNALAGICFLVGVLLLVTFVSFNLPK